MSDEWGPWIEHDGKGCPSKLLGRIIEAEFISEDGEKITGYRTLVVTPLIASCASWYAATYLGEGHHGTWDGKSFPMEFVRRYCIKKPKAMKQLIKIAEKLLVEERTDA